MARTRMSWDWVGDTPVAVFTTWIDKAHFKVSLRKGFKRKDNNLYSYAGEDGLGPDDPVWFEYEQRGLWSKDEVVAEALRRAAEELSLYQTAEFVEGAPKHDDDKQRWHSMPIEVLKGLSDVFTAGAEKYYKFSCLGEFENGDARFWDAMMRHLEQCQTDPLAKDEETDCFHGYQAAWNILMRTYHAERKGKK